jgi:hypothetical protein
MTRFTAALGAAREAEQKLRDGAGLLVEKQTVAEAQARLARDASTESFNRASEAIGRSRTAFEAAQLTLQKSTEAYDRLRASAGVYYQAIPIGTLATDKSVIAHQRLIEAQETVDLNTRRLAEAQRGIADAISSTNLAQERQNVLLQQQALEQDKATREAMKQQQGPLGVFQKLGLDPSTLGDTAQALGKVIAAVGKIGDATERAALLRQLYGKGWAENAALIQLNQESLDKLGLQLIGVTEEDKKRAEEFNKSWSRLTQTFEGIKNAIGNTLGQALVPVFNSISDFFLHNKEEIRSWAEAATATLSVFMGAMREVGTVVGDVAGVIGHGIGMALEAFNQLFGADVGVKDLVAFAVGLAGVAKAFALMRVAFLALNAVMGPWGLALTAISLIVIELIKHFDELKATAIAVGNAIARIIGLKSDVGDVAPSAPAIMPGMASGGLIRGPGTGTSDSIPIWASDHEFIVNSTATRMWLPVLRAINSFRMPALPRLSAPNHFASGGLVAASGMIQSAWMGLPQSLRESTGVNVTFNLAGHNYPSLMHRKTADDLIATAREQKLLSAGRQQSWKTE